MASSPMLIIERGTKVQISAERSNVSECVSRIVSGTFIYVTVFLTFTSSLFEVNVQVLLCTFANFLDFPGCIV